MENNDNTTLHSKEHSIKYLQQNSFCIIKNFIIIKRISIIFNIIETIEEHNYVAWMGISMFCLQYIAQMPTKHN